jgi:hypothetical protein
MPTGYTDAVRKGCSFEQFVWSCARAFGALVLMRDDPADASIPQEFKPSPFYADRLTEAESALATCIKWTPEEADSAAQASHDAKMRQLREMQKENADTEARYRDMLAMVRGWVAPSSEHTKLREFMIEQLESSIEFDCRYQMPLPTRIAGAEYREQRIAELQRDVTHYQEEYGKELERTRQRNEWLRALRESVPYPAASANEEAST